MTHFKKLVKVHVKNNFGFNIDNKNNIIIFIVKKRKYTNLITKIMTTPPTELNRNEYCIK